MTTKHEKPSAPVVERAVRFRFNQHCFIEQAVAMQGEIRELPVDVAERLAARDIGAILSDEPSTEAT